MKKIFIACCLAVVFCLSGASFASAVILPNAPDYEFWYGSAPTVAGMMMGYYDRNGYGGLTYSNLVPGGTAEASSYGNPGAIANSAIASAGHITDFYSAGYGGSGDDVSPLSHSFNSLADFMGTSQDSIGNINGNTTFYYYTNGDKLTATDAFTYGVWNSDGMYGIGEYINYAGYGVTNLYTQHIYSSTVSNGFTFADYTAEIDAGRPVMIHLTGHTIFGYGYDAANNMIYFHDTWSAGQHDMTWGGSYSSMDQWGVTCFELTRGESPNGVPEPATMLLLGLGLMGLAGVRRLKK